MSVIATAHATDEEMRALGLRKRGDLINLRRFCVEKVQEAENKERLNERKDLLEKVLDKNKSKRRLETFSSFPRKELFLDLSPNAKKVIKALHPEVKSKSEKQSFEFLKQFIKSLDRSSLKGFLKFVTGSDVLLKDQKISVAFYLVDGLARRPNAHSCGPLLELPCT